MKQDKRKTDTKVRIIRAGIRLFAARGLDRVSIRDLAAEVGITAASFYNHFRSKTDLLTEMFSYCRQKVIEPVAASIDLEKMMTELGAAGFLAALIEYMFRTEHDEELYQLSRIIAAEQFKNETAAEIAYSSRQRSRELLTGLLARMEEKGLIRTGAPETVARIMSYALTGMSVDYYHQRYIQEMAPEEIMEKQKEFVVLFCNQILDPGDRHPGQLQGQPL